MVQTQCEHDITTGWKLCNMVGAPQVSWVYRSKRRCMDGNKVILREKLWCTNSIYDYFTTTATVDQIIKANASKVPQKAKT